MITLKGICIGDVNGDYNYIPNRMIPDIQLTLANEQLTINSKNQTIEIPVKVTRDIQLGAIGLKFNVGTYHGMSAPMLNITDVISDIDGLEYNTSDNSIAVAWAALNNKLNLKQGDILFKLKVQIQKLNAGDDVSGMIPLDPESLLGDGCGNRLTEEKLSIPFLTTNNQQLTTNIYPNPFNSTTTIEYNLPEDANVNLTVYNIYGKEIETLVNTYQTGGVYKVNYNADASSDGAYIYKLTVQGKDKTQIKTGVMMISK